MGSNKREIGTVRMGTNREMVAQGNKGTNLDGLRLQFEAIEGVDGFVCVVGVRVVHKPIAEALPCGQDQDNDLPPQICQCPPRPRPERLTTSRTP